jgi:hypothetical protein
MSRPGTTISRQRKVAIMALRAAHAMPGHDVLTCSDGGALVVALETVKKHVSHILGKLGAANRTQAVARARALGLLQ